MFSSLFTGEPYSPFIDSFEEETEDKAEISEPAEYIEAPSMEVEQEEKMELEEKMEPEKDVFLEDKLKQLEVLTNRVERIELKLENANRNRSTEAAHLAAFKWWFQTFGAELKAYDVLASSKHRTFTSGCVEALMKILCELDQVQSEGRPEIRGKRKALVKKINTVLLPYADELLSKAEKLLRKTNEILDLVKSTKAKDADEAKANTKESLETETDEVDPEPEPASEEQEPDVEREENIEASNSNDSLSKVDAMDTSTEEPNNLPHNHRIARKNVETEKPMYEIKEVGGAVHIRVKIPQNESQQSCLVKLEDGGNTVAVYGNSFCLPFEVNRNTYDTTEAAYKFVTSRILQITIPRRRVIRQRVFTPRQRGFSPYEAHSSPFRRSNPLSHLGWAM